MKRIWRGLVDLVRHMIGGGLVQPIAGGGLTLLPPGLVFGSLGGARELLGVGSWGALLVIPILLVIWFFTCVAWAKVAEWCSQSEDNWLLNFLEPHHRAKLLSDAAWRERGAKLDRAGKAEENRD